MTEIKRTEETQLAVIGGGPGGYVAAFRAADLGIQTTLIDSAPVLGGVCLRQGCIPSKALLHVAHLIQYAAEAADYGVTFAPPRIEIERLRAWKQGIVDKLCEGVGKIAKSRKIRVVNGRASFLDANTLEIVGADVDVLKCRNVIVASGSRPARLPEMVLPSDCCIDSTVALDLADVPETLAVIGGGYIGLELGQVYATLGSRVSIIEMLPRLLPGADEDLVRPLSSRLKKEFAAIHTGARLESAVCTDAGVELTFSKAGKLETHVFDRVLSSIGRVPNTESLGLENTRVQLDDRRFIKVDAQRRTADPSIFAIGDAAGEPMLAHAASREGVVAAEVIAGKLSEFAPRAVPAVVYTSPEIAWCGLTENKAKEQGVDVKVGKVQWGGFGRALAMGRPLGTTKIIADAQTGKLLGVGIVGEHAGDLIAEATLAIETGADVERLTTTIHAHPTTSETILEAAESVFGRAIHSTR